ncbi:hypothetical protein RMN56_25090 [Micromonospora halotolerans]|uniref:Uncharacterized protein n=1 Tax=Micromonospora halotolerans TaxID=709879 RepID=A0ABY9ZSX1_9ACTN|nr:hypothetical protein [Micromonospora halotolerans]WNM38383.1 hypothetical protein RMN56_25090 [Micromonospora halotolerans]
MSVLSPCPAERVEPIVVEEMTAEGLTRPDPDDWRSADGPPYGYHIQSDEQVEETRAAV